MNLTKANIQKEKKTLKQQRRRGNDTINDIMARRLRFLPTRKEKGIFCHLDLPLIGFLISRERIKMLLRKETPLSG